MSSDAWCVPTVDNTCNIKKDFNDAEVGLAKCRFPTVAFCSHLSRHHMWRAACSYHHHACINVRTGVTDMELKNPFTRYFVIQIYSPREGRVVCYWRLNVLGWRMWHLYPSSFWNVYIEVLKDPAQWLISPLHQPPDALLFYVVWWTKTFYQTRERQWTVLQVATRCEMRIVRSFQNSLIDLWRRGIL